MQALSDDMDHASPGAIEVTLPGQSTIGRKEIRNYGSEHNKSIVM